MAETAAEALASLIEQGNRLAAYCCSLDGNTTFDAVRCWNECREDMRRIMPAAVPLVQESLEL